MRLLLSLVALTFAALVAASGLPSSVEADEYPPVLRLPDGWLPEGIVIANQTLYSGSRRHGGIYAIDLETGDGRVLVAGRDGRAATGLKFDARTGYIFASGAATGDLHVYDSATGANVASYKLAATPGPTFINDVIITPNAAYVTDSMRPVLYRLPLGQDGQLPPAGDVTILPLSGDYAHATGFNLNGIESAGSRLIATHGNGTVFEIDPTTGRASRIDVGSPVRGDGLLFSGDTLYAVVNAQAANEVLKVEIAPDFRSGSVVGRLTNAAFDSPTTIAKFGNKLYVVNARFMSGNAPTISYTIVTLDHLAEEE